MPIPDNTIRVDIFVKNRQALTHENTHSFYKQLDLASRPFVGEVIRIGIKSEGSEDFVQKRYKVTMVENLAAFDQNRQVNACLCVYCEEI